MTAIHLHGGDLHLGLGFEFEGVLKVKSGKLEELSALGYMEFHRHMSRAQREDMHRNNALAVKKYLHDALDQAGLASEVRAAKGAKNYTLWGIESDSSLASAETRGQSYGIEIVSPVLYAHNWQGDLQKLFRVIERVFVILDKDEAATHIHVAPRGREWTPEELGSISKGLSVCMDHLRHVLPRRRDSYATWNDERWKTEGVNVFNLQADGKEFDKDFFVHGMSSTRYVAWNFRPLLDSRGTIEFRRPYQSLGWKHAAHWVTLTLGLFSVFLRYNPEKVPKDPEAFKVFLGKEVK